MGQAGITPDFLSWSVVILKLERRHLNESNPVIALESIANMPHGGDRQYASLNAQKLRNRAVFWENSFPIGEVRVLQKGSIGKTPLKKRLLFHFIVVLFIGCKKLRH